MKQIVKEIRKRENVIIRIGRGNLGGYNYGEIRQYTADETGNYIPTQKGLTFTPELIDELIDGFNKLKTTFKDSKG
jgi:hypothetical protein